MIQLVREAANAGVDSAQDRAPLRTWLVLTGCLDCNPRTGRYCRNHDEKNWWLTEWGNGGAKRNAPGSTT